MSKTTETLREIYKEVVEGSENPEGPWAVALADAIARLEAMDMVLERKREEPPSKPCPWQHRKLGPSWVL